MADITVRPSTGEIVIRQEATTLLIGTSGVGEIFASSIRSGSASLGYALLADGAGAADWAAIPSGDVTGPVSATVNAIATWADTGAAALLNTTVTVDGSGNVVIPSVGSISKPGSGTDSEAFGSGASATGIESTSIGKLASATNAGALAFGYNASAAALRSTAVGGDAVISAGGTNGVALGHSASVGGLDGIAVGHSASASLSAMAIGAEATAALDGMAIGIRSSSQSGHTNAVAIGRDSATTAASRVTLGTIGGARDLELQVGLGAAFWGSTPPGAQPTITGSRGGNAALASLLTELAATGLIVDGTS